MDRRDCAAFRKSHVLDVLLERAGVVRVRVTDEDELPVGVIGGDVLERLREPNLRFALLDRGDHEDHPGLGQDPQLGPRLAAGDQPLVVQDLARVDTVGKDN